MDDLRTPLERAAWNFVGPPLYYCAECLLRVRVMPVSGAAPDIVRDSRCHHSGEIIAPRRATLVGKGGVSLATRLRVKAHQTGARLTGRDA